MKSLQSAWIFLVFLVLSFSKSDKAFAQGKCLNDERGILLQLNESLISAMPLKRSSWSLNTDCCSWDGIKCDSAGHITSLDLSGQGILGGENNFASILGSISKLSQLQHLDLSNNSFTGPLDELFQGSLLNQLQHLDLSKNSFNGRIGEFSVGPSSPLQQLDLSNNQLQGPVPASIFKFSKLESLGLASNNFSGTIVLDMLFQKLKNLCSLDLSDNRLSVDTASANFTLYPQLNHLFLSSCDLTEFPTFLKNQFQVINLDLSNNQIHGNVPNWIWEMGNYGLHLVNLSNNFLNDPDQPVLFLKSSAFVLDLHSNKFQGKNTILAPHFEFLDYSFNSFTSMIADISSYLSTAAFFSLSNNQINGEIPTWICELENLQSLDFSHNNLSGPIPACLGTMSIGLEVLNLRGNNLQGIIPDTFPNNTLLKKLDLNGNQLEGPLPKSLANCTQLMVFDVGNNQLSGTFPSWFGNMQQLRVLILRSNEFYGPWWGNKASQRNFPKLQIIDISYNKFSGILSEEYFSSWSGMMIKNKREGDSNDEVLGFRFEVNDVVYRQTVTITIKGVEVEVVKILDSFTAVDFSSNQFEGEIPESIGNLTLLYTLNLSRNALAGPILTTIGNLKHLESLDLSRNKLIGEIPVQLASLSSLAVLDLSFNKLAGKIPSGNQIQTFKSNAFEGNDGLWGFPLAKNCSTIIESPPNVLSSRDRFDWILFTVSFLGFVVGASMVIGPQYFWKEGREWFNERINKILNIS